MDTSVTDEFQRRIFGICLFVAPLLLLASSIVGLSQSKHWGGVLQVYAFMLFIPAMFGLTSLLSNRVRRMVLRTALSFGCIGGIGYGLDRDSRRPGGVGSG